jgi:hypothetical protein
MNADQFGQAVGGAIFYRYWNNCDLVIDENG